MKRHAAAAGLLICCTWTAFAAAAAPAPERQVSGTIRRIEGLRLTVVTRSGRTLVVDDAGAWRAHLSAVPVVGRSVTVRGTYGSDRVLHAETMQRAKDSVALWPADR